MLGFSGRNPRANHDSCRSWRLAVKRGSTRSCLRQGFGRAGAWKRSSLAKAGEEGDSRIERFVGCSLRSGRLQTLEGRIFPSGVKQAVRPRASAQGQLDAALYVDDGSRFAVGERVRGDRGQTLQ
jgi:hypothetical protein